MVMSPTVSIEPYLLRHNAFKPSKRTDARHEHVDPKRNERVD